MSTTWFEIFGYAATLCMIFGYMPQAIRTMRTRDTSGISTATFLLMALGSIFFVAQGFLSDPINLPLIITNSITTVCAAIVFAIKVHNDYFLVRNPHTGSPRLARKALAPHRMVSVGQGQQNVEQKK